MDAPASNNLILPGTGVPGAATPSPGGLGSPPPTTPSPDAELARLRQENDNLRGLYSQLAPYSDAIDWLTSDERAQRLASDKELRERIYQSWDAMDAVRRTQAPATPPELKPLEEKLEKVERFVGGLQEAQQSWQRAQDQQAYRINYEFAQRLVGEKPEFARDNYKPIKWLMNAAASEGITLEDAYKQLGSVYSGAASAPIPDRSLRADAGTPGVPSERRPAKIETKQQAEQYIAGVLRRGMGG